MEGAARGGFKDLVLSSSRNVIIIRAAYEEHYDLVLVFINKRS